MKLSFTFLLFFITSIFFAQFLYAQEATPSSSTASLNPTVSLPPSVTPASNPTPSVTLPQTPSPSPSPGFTPSPQASASAQPSPSLSASPSASPSSATLSPSPTIPSAANATPTPVSSSPAPSNPSPVSTPTATPTPKTILPVKNNDPPSVKTAKKVINTAFGIINPPLISLTKFLDHNFYFQKQLPKKDSVVLLFSSVSLFLGGLFLLRRKAGKIIIN